MQCGAVRRHRLRAAFRLAPPFDVEPLDVGAAEPLERRLHDRAETAGRRVPSERRGTDTFEEDGEAALEPLALRGARRVRIDLFERGVDRGTDEDRVRRGVRVEPAAGHEIADHGVEEERALADRFARFVDARDFDGHEARDDAPHRSLLRKREVRSAFDGETPVGDHDALTSLK